ncbi:hypothetical protein PV396_08420 [Streptomyces sp. ME02-8801-2C]|uniref:hypothetical protein n=1 Tax=Streptomyces sp. ME02-8801-2C TaxID=3028680 RepID=UPI0029A5327E|nr:hypothetical protein [Streptomyces sp. ME02-8801-2C]MDX3451971.1 hypothetical protein [Streptomyces sp. ME02-8801-2C]
MVRYVHHQLAAAVEMVIAMAVTMPVIFGVRGLPHAGGGSVILLLGFLGAFFGLLAVSVRSHWLGGEKREFENAAALADPETILPAPRESIRGSFDGSFIVFTAMFSLVFGLLWGPWVNIWVVVSIPERIVKGVYASFWERRHGVLLWRGRIAEQPLGKGQFLYSSPRNPSPG